MEIQPCGGTDYSGVRRELRRRTLQARDGLSPQERERGALLLTERILGHQWFYRSEILLGFASYGSEIETSELLEETVRMGKKLFLPKVTNVSHEQEMRFYRVTDLSDLSVGFRGIPEPAGDTEEYCYHPSEAERTLLLMPGVAFDGFRNRLGYGKGFYDRFLADKEALQLRTIAVGFQCQMVEEIPVREGDIRPYQVICV